MTMEAQTNEQAVEPRRRNRRALQGLVVSDKMSKTIVVEVNTYKKHAQYKKYVRRTNKYLAHDETEQCGVGDLVTIVETRPLSRRKRWQVRSVDRKAVG
jgi:small subunit ribosomal protein S17